MATDQQQYAEENFAEDQQYADYGENNYGDQYQGEGMEEGGENDTGGGNLNGDSVDIAPKSPSDEDKKLFVGGISWDTEQKDLKDYFSTYGEVTDVTIKTDPNTGKSRGFAFVTFSSEDTVVNVLKSIPHSIKGKTVDPKRAKMRPGIKKIFVGGLESDYPETDIKAYFEKYGKVAQVELPFDKVKNQRRQFCFVTFETEEACEAACKQAKQKIGTKDCDVKKATSNLPPRGGGRGGPGWGAPATARGGRGRGVRGRGAPGYSQPQGWGPQGGYGGYGAQGYGYNQGYGNYGNYDYSGYGGGYGSGYGGGYGGYDYSGWNYGQGGGGYGGAGYGQQQSSYGKAPRRGGGAGAPAAAGAGYHPYSR